MKLYTIILLLVANSAFSQQLKVINFKATLENQNISIAWKTVLEDIGTLYIIEKSMDGIQFNAIDTLEGIKQLNYKCHDKHDLTIGLCYYRLLIKVENRKDFLDVVALELPDKQVKMSIENNRIQYNKPVKIFDLSGRLVKFDINPSIADLTKGMYVAISNKGILKFIKSD
jgi:hypothetical protein